ncbi:hypothetical protein D3C80_2153960 [compost metagenome]
MSGQHVDANVVPRDLLLEYRRLIADGVKLLQQLWGYLLAITASRKRFANRALHLRNEIAGDFRVRCNTGSRQGNA